MAKCARSISVCVYFEKMEKQERKRIAWPLEYSSWPRRVLFRFEQQGSSLNLFTDRYTDMVLFGFTITNGWLQSVPPLSVII